MTYIEEQLYAAMDPEGFSDRDFIPVGGMYVHPYDFVDMWNGKKNVEPRLSMADKESALRAGGHDLTTRYQTGIEPVNMQTFLGRWLPKSWHLGRAQKKKAKDLWNMIERYKKERSEKLGADEGLPKTLDMQVVLAALDTHGTAKFSTMGEFLAAYVTASPSPENARLLQEGIAEIEETTGELVVKSHFVDEKSSRYIGEVIEGQRLKFLSEVIGIPEYKLRRMPTILLERASLEHPTSQDDLYGLAYLRRLQSPMPDVIHASRTAILLAGMGTAVAGIMQFDEAMMMTGFKMGGIGLFLIYAYNTEAKQVPFSLQKGQKKYKKDYEKMKKKIGVLKKTGIGKLQVSLLREIALATYETDDLGRVEEIGSYVNGIQENPAYSKAFEEYCERYVDAEGFNTYEGTMTLLHEFRTYLGRVEAAEDEIAQSEDLGVQVAEFDIAEEEERRARPQQTRRREAE